MLALRRMLVNSAKLQAGPRTPTPTHIRRLPCPWGSSVPAFRAQQPSAPFHTSICGRAAPSSVKGDNSTALGPFPADTLAAARSGTAVKQAAEREERALEQHRVPLPIGSHLSAFPMASPKPHTGLSVYIQDCQIAIQPRGPHSSSQVETLSINLDTGKVQVLISAPQSGTPAVDAVALLGLCKLHAGNALLLATSAKPVGKLQGSEIFEIASTKVVASDEARRNKCNRGLLRLLEEGIDPKGAGRGLYFSYNADITQVTQRAAALALQDPKKWASELPVQRASSRYFWNQTVASPLLAAGAQAFVQPCILGFVGELPGLRFKEAHGKEVTGTLTLIARRAVARAGTRQWRRGADPQGAVANFAETEQILTIEGPPDHPLAGTTTAYVLVRGSIPLLWTQLPNIKYKPTTVIAPSDLSGPAHDKHFANMVERYDSVVAINLINHHGTEGKLEAAFRQESTRLIGSESPVGRQMRYIAFDFHAECGNKRYHRLSLLWDQINEDFAEQSFCQLSAEPPTNGSEAAAARSVRRSQSGVMRVNCIDCLDRTNVVQGVIARKSLESVLSTLGLLGKGLTLPEAYPEVERQFKILWADHGDALSTQYAGTGAMKSGFTRTGKRTIAGVIDDGVKAVVRYYLNNYQDGVKQDAIDLITGAYQCDTITVPPLKPQPSPLIPIVVSMLALGVATHNVMAVIGHFAGAPPPPTLPDTTPDSATAHSNVLGAARRLAGAVLFSPPSGGAAASSGGVTLSAAAAPLADASAASAVESAHEGWMPALLGSLTAYVFVPLALGAGLLFLVIKNGKYLVNKPQLCPQLAVTVLRPPKEHKKAA